jgi:hypothetical protein
MNRAKMKSSSFVVIVDHPMKESAKDRLRKILGGAEGSADPSAADQPASSARSVPAANNDPGATRPIAPVRATPIEPAKPIGREWNTPPPLGQNKSAASLSPSDVRARLQELRAKMAHISEEFALGEINRMQFEAIYKHYQEQLQQIENLMYSQPGSDAWQGAMTQGVTGRLRERHKAQVISYAIYDNASSMPLATVGSFNIDTSLLVPMLSSFRSATAEMFGAGLRSTEIEGGRWLCFVPGNFTTLIALFSIEPAKLQLNLIEDLHKDFEMANAPAFKAGQAEEAAISFTRIWALDSFSPTSLE